MPSTNNVGTVTVPVNVGLLFGAFRLTSLIKPVIVDPPLTSRSSSSLSVSKAVPAPLRSSVNSACTKAVVAICVVLVFVAAVGEVGVPVNAGLANVAKPDIDAPAGIVTVPVNVVFYENFILPGLFI